jgi:hypothetical protein
MGFFSIFQTVAESKELHSDPQLRSRYYKANYRTVKAHVIEHAKTLQLDVRSVDDEHREIFLQGSRYHIIVSIVQVNPIETSVDFKVEFYGLIGRGRPKKTILAFYQYLDANLPFKGVGLHP